MTIAIRRSEDRGRTSLGWLDSRHTFSFGAYHDPRHTGFRALRVINEDRVRPGAGFGKHAHRDMEILSYVVSGSLAHEDSMGNGSVLGPGDVQRMTAGTGVEHSEMNPSLEDPVHFLQVWIEPERSGLEPGYEERHFSDEEKRDRLAPIASGTGAGGALAIHRDVEVYASLLGRGRRVEHALRPGRHAWIQVVRGALDVDGHALGPGDGASIGGGAGLVIEATQDAELILFDLA